MITTQKAVYLKQLNVFCEYADNNRAWILEFTFFVILLPRYLSFENVQGKNSNNVAIKYFFGRRGKSEQLT